MKPKRFDELPSDRRERILGAYCLAHERYPTPYVATRAETQFLFQVGRYICGWSPFTVPEFRGWWERYQSALFERGESPLS